MFTTEVVTTAVTEKEPENKVQQVIKDTYYRRNLKAGLSAVGFAAGIWLAIDKKAGFWGGVGYALLGSISGGAVGMLTGTIIDKSKTGV